MSHPISIISGTPLPSRLKNLIGKRFSRLVVSDYVGVSKHQQTLWLCMCDCYNNGHYELGNVKWSTKKEQVLNRRPAERWVAGRRGCVNCKKLLKKIEFLESILGQIDEAVA